MRVRSSAGRGPLHTNASITRERSYRGHLTLMRWALRVRHHGNEIWVNITNQHRVFDAFEKEAMVDEKELCL